MFKQCHVKLLHVHNLPDPSLLSKTEATMSSHQLFSSDTYTTGEEDHMGPRCDTLGDVAVKTLSEMVLNDQPARDPRWGDTRGKLAGLSFFYEVYVCSWCPRKRFAF